MKSLANSQHVKYNLYQSATTAVPLNIHGSFHCLDIAKMNFKLVNCVLKIVNIKGIELYYISLISCTTTLTTMHLI